MRLHFRQTRGRVPVEQFEPETPIPFCCVDFTRR
jgi:hypothetical protein